MFTNTEVKEQMNRIETCLNCKKSDGCYTCREKTADMDLVAEMLKELLK